MADRLRAFFDVECDRLDSHAHAFRHNSHRKQLRLKLAKVQSLLRNDERFRSNQNSSLSSWFTDLEDIAYDVDELIDDWEQSEKSKSKIEQEERRIHGRLVQLLGSFPKLVSNLNTRSLLATDQVPALSTEIVEEGDDVVAMHEHEIQLNSPENHPSEREDPVKPADLMKSGLEDKKSIKNPELSTEIVEEEDDVVAMDEPEIQLHSLETVKPADPITAIKMIAMEDEMLRKSRLEDKKSIKNPKLSTEIVEEKDDVVAMKEPEIQLPSPESHQSEREDPMKSGLEDKKSIKNPEFSTEIVEEKDDVVAMDEPEIQLPSHENSQSEREDPMKSGLEDKKSIMEDEMLQKSGLEDKKSIKNPEFSTEIVEEKDDVVAMDEPEIQLPSHENSQSEREDPMKSGLEDKKSIKKTVRKILSYMNDVGATRIGVHGIGGVGKTTVVKALASHPKTKSMFDVILLVTVSRYWSVRKIQDKVSRQLLHCENTETNSEVAVKLFQNLKDKKFLLLLDDVWEQIDFKAVGIPDPSSENGCKILMASRKLDVCRKMDVIKLIEVKPISKKEAKELFYKQLGRIIRSEPDIQPFAKAIVKGCGGLPLLIIVSGKALAEENNVSVWEHASRKFSLPRKRVFQIEDVIQLLKFSFDQLKDDDVKTCFLHCALFPEDQEISIFRFVEYCIQEGIITGAQVDAYERGRGTVNVLVDASLLELTNKGKSIKMHDLIRDLALGILSSEAEDRTLHRTEGSQFLLKAYSRCKELSNPGSSSSSRLLNGTESSRLTIPEGHQFLLRAGAGLTEPPLEEEWTQAKMIFLMDNDLRTLPERLSCPELLTLFLQRNSMLRTIPISFFDSMTFLKVLNLSKTRINSLPKTLFKLKNLEILILQDCERLDMLPPEVGCLENLEVLDLQGTEILKLPDEVGQLASLRHLKVCFYGSIDDSEYIKPSSNLISSGTISRLQALETLSIVVFPGDERWIEDVKYVKSEVNKLKKLSSLCFHFPEVEHLQQFLEESIPWNDKRLVEFKFVVGPDAQRITSRVPDYVEFDYNQQAQCLRYVNGEKKPDEVLQMLARSTAFYLDHHLDMEILSNFGVNYFNMLKFCIISDCPEIRTVVRMEEHSMAIFPRLENLSIHHLWNLTCICERTKEIVPEGSFAELRTLSVHACPKLVYVFSSSVTQCLSKLEELTIEECPAIEEIIVQGEILDSHCIALPGLRKLKLHSLPGLHKIWRSPWPLLESISFYDCPKLKKIDVDSRLKHTITKIKAEKSWWDTLEWEDTELGGLLGNRLTIICEDDQYSE